MTDSFDSQHRQTWDLIPWFVNGTACDSERLSVEQHLERCGDCRQELEFQRRLHGALTPETDSQCDTDTQTAWARLRERLDASEPASVPSRLRRVRATERSWMPWVMAAMLLQAIGLGAIGAAFWSRPPALNAASSPATAPYRTLSAALPPTSQATVRVVFASSMTLAQLHALLSSAGLQVVSGPGEADVWSLGPTGQATHAVSDQAVRTLRASANVRFAEPIGGAP